MCVGCSPFACLLLDPFSALLCPWEAGLYGLHQLDFSTLPSNWV